MTCPLLHRLRHEDGGFTMIELVVAMALAIGALIAILNFGDAFTSQASNANKLVQAEDDSRRIMTEMVRRVRDAPLPAGATAPATPFVRIGAHDIVVSGTTFAGTPGWIRYCTGTGSDGAVDGALRIGTLAGAYVDPGTPCTGAPASGWTYGTLVASGVLGAGTLFQFTCPTTCTPQNVTSMAVRLQRSTNGGRSIVLRSAVTPRNRL